jgi:uncharacterized RDD family membrane protein YckC
MNIDLGNAAAPGLLRRLAAIFYDSWLVVGIWLLGVIIDTFVRDEKGLGLAISHLPLQLFFIVAPLLFFGWFWTHGGQTLGMRAWRLKLLADSGEPVSARQAIVRFFAACLSALVLALGYLWVLFDRDRKSWHDHISGTRLVMLAR